VRDWTEIREIARTALNPTTDTVATPSSTTTSSSSIAPPKTGSHPTSSTPVIPTLTKIEVKNGTSRTGFASQISAMLEKFGYEIMSFGNAVRKGRDRTMIYDLTNGAKPDALAKLQKALKADVSPKVPEWIQADTATATRAVWTDGLAKERIFNQSTDFLVILGEGSYGILNP
jgi:hypothetical protein